MMRNLRLSDFDGMTHKQERTEIEQYVFGSKNALGAVTVVAILALMQALQNHREIKKIAKVLEFNPKENNDG